MPSFLHHDRPTDVGPWPSPPPNLPAHGHPYVLVGGASTHTGMHETPPQLTCQANDTAIPEISGYSL